MKARTALLLATAGLLLPAVVSAQTVEYYSLDAIGSVRVVTDRQGKVIERHDYLPFGEECTTGPCASNPGVGAGEPRKFTGKERDPETTLDYFGARYYGSRIGRFTSVDPAVNLKASLVQPQRWNRYSYVSNNPFGFVDPDGREQAVIMGGKTYMAGVDGQSAGNTRAKNIVFAGLVGTTVAAAGGVAGVVALTPVEFTTTATTGSVVLGETMKRVEPAARALNAGTFSTTWTYADDVLAKNMQWLRAQIANGSRLFDVGLDPSRTEAERSAFYAAEARLMQAAGFVRQQVAEIDIGGTATKVYEWLLPASGTAK